MIKESEFRKKVLDRVHVVAEEQSTVEWAVALAKEAGATFAPEAVKLPSSMWPDPVGGDPGMSVLRAPARDPRFGSRYLSTEESMEIIRRCKAVEEAVEYLLTKDLYGHSELVEPLLAILEGTK